MHEPCHFYKYVIVFYVKKYAIYITLLDKNYKIVYLYKINELIKTCIYESGENCPLMELCLTHYNIILSINIILCYNTVFF